VLARAASVNPCRTDERSDGEIWCQVLSTDADGMLAEAREIRSCADDVVKLPMRLAAMKAEGAGVPR
jgi:transaldolase